MRTVFVSRDVPAEARKACSLPAMLPERDLTASETATLWGRDRSALRVCEARRAAAVGDVVKQ